MRKDSQIRLVLELKGSDQFVETDRPHYRKDCCSVSGTIEAAVG